MNSDDPTTDDLDVNDTGGVLEGTLLSRPSSDVVSTVVAATRNPWDDDHPDAATAVDPDDALTMRLLRPSVISLAVCTVVIFISAVASSNAIASSPLEQVSLAIHRLGMFGLLLSFLGILTSYRLPAISRFLQSDSWRKSDRALNRNSHRSGMQFLLMANVALIVASWLIAYSGIPLLLLLLRIASLISVGVLLGIVLVKRGILQAYAVGVLVALFLVSLNSLLLATHSSQPYRFNSVQYRWMISSAFAWHVTVALGLGLISATIYMMRARVKLRQSTDS